MTQEKNLIFISSYLMYWDAINLCRWVVSQKLPMNGFEWRKDKFTFDEEFIPNYDQDSDKWYILEVNIMYPYQRHKLNSNPQSLPKRKKID